MELGIQQAAQEVGISAHTLRYYERIGLITDVPRDPAGHRRYDEDRLRWLDFLTKLRSTGMPIQGMLRYAELNAHLAVIETKIGNYKTGVHG